MEGIAYVFLRKDGAPLPPGCAGHVGWGFTFAKSPGDMDAFCGSTENFSGSPLILPGQDIGYWTMPVDREVHMYFQFKQRNYHAVKRAKVQVASPHQAMHEAKVVATGGYTAIGNNCLDHTCRILKAYGVKDLPWPLTHPSPSDWFAQFNGAYLDL
jgi:hypothetical protein